MASLEETLAQGVEDSKIPHAVVFATNADGSFQYKHAAGKASYPGDKSIEEDAVFMLASQTKLLTTIAALQLVERGYFSLKEDVSSKLPELGGQPIITGFDNEDKPILVKRKNPITLRDLLNHSSGVAYDAGHPTLIKLAAQRAHEPNTGDTVVSRYDYPLVFEPGTSFMYGASIDWAGQLVERLSGLSLDKYIEKNISKILGITSITFFSGEEAAVNAKVPGLVMRTPEGQLMPTSYSINTGLKDAFGGQGSYATMADYIKVQRSILANDGKLLKPGTVDLMFKPSLTHESAQGLKQFMHSPMKRVMIGELKDPDELEVNWGLGGLLFMRDDADRRKKGTLCWGGIANTFWLIDREADLALTFGTQVMPPGDALATEMITAVELAVYEKAGVKF